MKELTLVKAGAKERNGRLDTLARHWRHAPRRWGHPLHSLCSYFAMFPPHIPRVFIEWLTGTGDIVYDPFSGRGTAPMEACRLGRIGIGSDANPLAYVLTGSKVDPPTEDEVTLRLDQLARLMPRRPPATAPEVIRMLYTRKVTRQLCWLREQLDIEDRTDRFILSVILGLLHANYRPGSPPRGFSISMPNTFSMSPAYVRRYIARHRLRPPDVDVIEMVQRKVNRMCIPISTAQRGMAWKADARDLGYPPDMLAKLVFTSPPYLGVIKYGKYNWIRLWMLKHEPSEVDDLLFATASPRRYTDFMAKFLSSVQDVVRPDGYVCLVIGDVADRFAGTTINLSETVWHNAAKPAGWRRLGMLRDSLPQQHKVSRIWGHDKKGQATKTDRILILAPPGSIHRLPARPRSFAWNTAQEWAQSAIEEE